MIDAIWEWVIVLAVILILFGNAKKIPEFARNLGRASGEFKKGQAEIQNEITKMTNPENNVNNPDLNSRIMETASSMGIDTRNKSIDQVKKELSEKLKTE
ncbi:twin-arginine translocase TatA/TatE family subunit [Caldiplasma sukawensis]